VIDQCYCAGCVGMGPYDDGEECSHGCGRRASTPWGTCQSCEDEITGHDEATGIDRGADED